jgi:hypothetical protein
MQVERSATLTPAISTSNWEQGIATRLVLFQDWTMVNPELRNVRLVGVQKSNNQASPDGIGLVFPFEICNVRHHPFITYCFHINLSRVALLG